MTIARANDPKTSQLGAEHISRKLGRMQQYFLDCLNATTSPRTASEVGAMAAEGLPDVTAESVRKRARELCDKGLIGRRGARRCGVTGKQAETYELTAKGRSVL